MLIEQKMNELDLTESQKCILDFILGQQEKIESMTVKEIAEKTYTSTGSVIRTAQKLGYSGFEEFKNDYLKELNYLNHHFKKIDPNYPFKKKDSIQKIASKITSLSKEALDDTLSLIHHDALQQAVQLLKDANHIYLVGLSYALMLGKIFQMDMYRIGKYVTVLDTAGEEFYLPSLLTDKDCVIAISYSGNTDEHLIPGKGIKQSGAKVIAITSLGENDLAKMANVVLPITTREKLRTKIKGYTTEISIKLILDILYSCYYQLEYDQNNDKRLKAYHDGDKGRTSTLNLVTEDME